MRGSGRVIILTFVYVSLLSVVTLVSLVIFPPEGVNSNLIIHLKIAPQSTKSKDNLKDSKNSPDNEKDGNRNVKRSANRNQNQNPDRSYKRDDIHSDNRDGNADDKQSSNKDDKRNAVKPYGNFSAYSRFGFDISNLSFSPANLLTHKEYDIFSFPDRQRGFNSDKRI